MTIPFTSITDCYREILDEVKQAVTKVMKKGQFINGEDVTLFEQEFAAYCDTKYAIGCSNGTDALILTLKALGIGEGDVVVTVPNTFIATTEAISAVGATIAFVDIDERTYTMSPESLSQFLSNNKATAIIPVHLYGQMANMPKIIKLAHRYQLHVIEDAAQAHGATLNGKQPGHFGDAATFSFFPGKNLGAFGDAGAVVTNNHSLANRIKMLSNHGRVEKYQHLSEGYNSRLDTLQAAILRVKLKHLTHWTNLRKLHAALYSTLLEDCPVTIPYINETADHSFHLYVIRVANRDQLQARLLQQGIQTGIHYPIPLHLQRAYRHYHFHEGDFPISEKISQEVLSLPFWPEMKPSQINEVCAAIIHETK
ncbi:DegT/DnrJ/EryC1/StrS family aminotransferase [Halalkalibacter sp. AB-rgal2]|uniref:DegT/DnrJ/EryC1/StrS family aminotransferase n=1 Tax=Halalkalibacter sp. AB-rgal2 TaxID=3242695 RepID=UPI00359DC30E